MDHNFWYDFDLQVNTFSSDVLIPWAITEIEIPFYDDTAWFW